MTNVITILGVAGIIGLAGIAFGAGATYGAIRVLRRYGEGLIKIQTVNITTKSLEARDP